MYNPYEVLGVEQNADESECKKAYRLLCKKYHPDNGGDANEYDKINKAYLMIKNGYKVRFTKKLKNRHLSHNSLFTYSVKTN